MVVKLLFNCIVLFKKKVHSQCGVLSISDVGVIKIFTRRKNIKVKIKKENKVKNSILKII